MSKKLTKFVREYKGDTYEVVPTGYIGFTECIRVEIRKVIHPEWKFFKTKFICDRYFSIHKNMTIEEGCNYCFNGYVQDCEREYHKQKILEELFIK